MASAVADLEAESLRRREELEDGLTSLRRRLRPRELLVDARSAALERARPITDALADDLKHFRKETAVALNVVGLAGVGAALMRGKAAPAVSGLGTPPQSAGTPSQSVSPLLEPAPRQTAIAKSAVVLGVGAAIGVLLAYSLKVSKAERDLLFAAKRDLKDLAVREFDQRLQKASSANGVRTSAMNLALAALVVLRKD